MIAHASDLAEFASDAAFAIDAEGKIVAWNVSAQRLLGYTPSEAIGRQCGDVLQATLPGGEPLCHAECDVLQCFRECRPYGVPGCRLRHRDGEYVPASMASVALSEETRRVYADNVMAVVFIHDGANATPVPQHRTLQIFTLGGFGVVMAGRSIDMGKWKRKKAVTLLKYLITQLDRPVHRERLLDCLWPDVDASRGWGRLKVTMYYLRRELRGNGMSDEVVKTVGKSYVLRRDAVWVDVDVFERLVTEGRSLQDQAQWGDALDRYVAAQRLYRGDYLEEETFADWCAEERERLHELYLETLARTAECHAELGQYAEVVQVYRKALVFDPCRESFHCLLMEYLVKYGRPDLALVQYRHCQEILAREFGAEPLPETQRIYRQILEGGDSAQVSRQGRY
ncbi:MAG: BTAD domain-containing putative transcriptional regulator [Woeseia sp.]